MQTCFLCKKKIKFHKDPFLLKTMRLDTSMTIRDTTGSEQKKNQWRKFQFISKRTGADNGRKDLFDISPVETSIKFDLPTRTSLSDVVQFPSQFSTNINNLSVGNLQIIFQVNHVVITLKKKKKISKSLFLTSFCQPEWIA